MPHYDPNHSKFMHLLEAGCILTFTGFCVLAAVTCVPVILLNQRACFPGNVLPGAWYYGVINFVLPIYSIWIVYMSVCLALLGIVVLYGAILVPFIVNELSLGGKKYRTSSSLRNPQSLTVAYRSVQILQLRIINESFGKYLVPTHSLATLLFIVSSFMMIRKRELFGHGTMIVFTSWASLSAGLWYVCLVIGGYLHGRGEKVLKSWKHYGWSRRADRMVMKKFRISCQPILISYGKLYTIRKMSGLIFIRGLVRGMKRTLLCRK